MSVPNNATPSAPSLADDLAQRMADHDCGCGSVEDVALGHPAIIAALRAAEVYEQKLAAIRYLAECTPVEGWEILEVLDGRL